MDLDLRLFGTDRPTIQAWWLGDIQVFVQVSSASPSFMADAPAYANGMRAAGYNRPRIVESFNVARNEIVGNEDRHSVYYLLYFDDAQPHGLDNSVFSAGLDNNRIRPNVIPVVSTVELPSAQGTTTVPSHRADIFWDIAMVEPFPRQVTEAQPRTNDLSSQLSLALGNLNLGT